MDPKHHRQLSVIERLLGCLGIAEQDFHDFVAWSLCEHLVVFLAQDRNALLEMRNKPDRVARFAVYVRDRTGRTWHIDDLKALENRVYMAIDKHRRKPIDYEDWLRVFFNTPLKCAKCGKSPPEVKLEIDHVFPSSRGGSSKAENLRFLCVKDNRHKSAKLEGGILWLSLK